MGRSDSLVALFRELAQLTVLDEGSPNAFRVRAYENAVEAIASYRGDLQALSEKELTAIAGIGPSTAKKIREFFEGGTIAKLEELRRKYPADFVELGKIPGLGPKTLLRLRSELGVRNLEDLRAALEGKKLRDVHGLGAKMEEKLLHALDRMGAAGKDKRRPIAEAMPIARELVADARGAARRWSAPSTAAASAASGRRSPTSTSWWPRASPRPCGRPS